ncbi:MAG: response regulator transcription factor [Clostridium sp.]|uniref:response regulator transcription factor n=1 Tax=Clostridium sp. TaxID=1506 RepID=UPI00302E9A2D
MSQGVNILVVEDDGDINELLCSILIKEGYNVRGAYSGTEARMCMERYDYDLILLDLMLPGTSGENLIDEIRKMKIMPIIVISAKSSQEDKIHVLRLGADDFISKPFDINEVIARVESQLRRYKRFSVANCDLNKLKHKNIEVDTDSRRVFVNEKEISLTAREFSILELLISNPNKVFTKVNLFESIWGDEYFGDDNTVSVHISNLRSKLAKADKDTEYIQTVWGIGFKLKD